MKGFYDVSISVPFDMSPLKGIGFELTRYVKRFVFNSMDNLSSMMKKNTHNSTMKLEIKKLIRKINFSLLDNAPN